MTERGASTTAVGVAALRAAHLLLDSPPPILDDVVAARLLGPGAAARILADPEALQTPRLRALRALVLVRSRYAEDRLRMAVERGVRQLVVLGAGLDTFAFRQPAWAHPLRILEVDHPASQADKRARLASADIPIPPNVVFAPIDFAAETLHEGLTRAGFDGARPAFFSWLGVTVYLPVPAVEAVLRYVGALARGTELVLSFAGPRDPGEGPSATEEMARAAGEPWLSRFEPADLLARLRDAGFSECEVPTLDEMAAYVAGRADGLPAPRRERLGRAMV